MSLKSEPKVSVITPVYNAARFLEQTIASVQAQSLKDFEYLLVIDNNSHDSSEVIARKLAANDPRLKIINDPKAKGAAANRNIGVQQAKGEYMAFIDADDLWLPNKLERQLQFMNEKKANFSFTAFTRISEDGQRSGLTLEVPERISYDELLKDNVIGCLTAIVRRSVYPNLSFSEVGWEDMAAWLSILRTGDLGYGLNESLAQYRIVDGSRSNNKLFAARLRWETLRKVEKFSVARSGYLFARYAMHGLRKHYRF